MTNPLQFLASNDGQSLAAAVKPLIERTVSEGEGWPNDAVYKVTYTHVANVEDSLDGATWDEYFLTEEGMLDAVAYRRNLRKGTKFEKGEYMVAVVYQWDLGPNLFQISYM